MYIGSKYPTFDTYLPVVVLEVQKEYRNHQGNKIRENDEVMSQSIWLLANSKRVDYTICSFSNDSQTPCVSLLSLNSNQLNL